MNPKRSLVSWSQLFAVILWAVVLSHTGIVGAACSQTSPDLGGDSEVGTGRQNDGLLKVTVVRAPISPVEGVPGQQEEALLSAGTRADGTPQMSIEEAMEEVVRRGR